MSAHRDIAYAAARAAAGGTLSAREFAIVDAALTAVGHPDDTPPKATGRRLINAEGRALIQSFEGLRLAAYKDAVGVWTIGWGSTGPHVKSGLTITRSEAEALFDQDLRRFEECVARNCPDATDNQFAAMVSLAFNVGCANFEQSTLLKKHKAGQHGQAQLQFARWAFAKGQKLNGLVRRRAAESAMYGR